MRFSIDIPDTLSEITLGQYQEWLSMDGNDEMKQLKMVEIFCGIPFGNLIKMKFNEVSDIALHLSSVLNEKPHLTQRFKVGKIEYGLIPNFDEMTFGEFTDLDDQLADWKTIHRAMYILYRPVAYRFGKYYSIVDYDGKLDKAKDLKQMPLSVVFGVVDFLLRLGIQSSRSILTSIEKQVEKEISLQGQPSLNATDGSIYTTHYLKEMQLALTELVNLTSMSALLTAHTKQVKTK